jgi:hypothetical protein
MIYAILIVAAATAASSSDVTLGISSTLTEAVGEAQHAGHSVVTVKVGSNIARHILTSTWPHQASVGIWEPHVRELYVDIPRDDEAGCQPDMERVNVEYWSHANVVIGFQENQTEGTTHNDSAWCTHRLYLLEKNADGGEVASALYIRDGPIYPPLEPEVRSFPWFVLRLDSGEALVDVASPPMKAGPPGINGTDGSQGAQGAQGARGTQCAPGARGARGTQGAKGSGSGVSLVVSAIALMLSAATALSVSIAQNHPREKTKTRAAVIRGGKK